MARVILKSAVKAFKNGADSSKAQSILDSQGRNPGTVRVSTGNPKYKVISDICAVFGPATADFRINVSPNLDPVRYLNDLISTFIEHDIVGSAGIERRASFMKALNLVAARVGQLFNASDIGVNVGADATTIQSWLSLMEMNGIVFKVPPYVTNINKRLTKTPKYFFFDVALAVRMQGWTHIEQLLMSPLAGQLFENMVCGELLRFFINSAQAPQISFARSKEKVEVDFLIDLGNMRYLAIEAKTTPCSYTTKQHALLDSLEINIIDRWIVSPTPAPDFPRCRVVVINELWNALMAMMM